jgi:hypothetical protein
VTLTICLQLVQMLLTQTPAYVALPLFTHCFQWFSPVATPNSELARTSITVGRAAILFFIRGSGFKKLCPNTGYTEEGFY